MVKLILSDIDGTLLPVGQPALSEELFDLIREFARRGVAFCPASGRQYASLSRLFRPVLDQVYLMCENGGGLYHNGETLSTDPLPREKANQVIRELYDREDSEVLISANGTLYILPERPHVQARGAFLNVTSTVHRAATVEDIPGDILRVSAYCHAPRGSVVINEEMGDRWRANGLQVAVSAQRWIDFTNGTKGSGLRHLCSLLGVDPAETVALGDNYNDLPLLEAAGRAYIMDTAAPELLERFPNHCHRAEDTLRELLRECEA